MMDCFAALCQRRTRYSPNQCRREHEQRRHGQHADLVRASPAHAQPLQQGACPQQVRDLCRHGPRREGGLTKETEDDCWTTATAATTRRIPATVPATNRPIFDRSSRALTTGSNEPSAIFPALHFTAWKPQKERIRARFRTTSSVNTRGLTITKFGARLMVHSISRTLHRALHRVS